MRKGCGKNFWRLSLPAETFGFDYQRHSNGNLNPFVPPHPEHKPPPEDRTLPTYWQCFKAEATLKPTFVPSVPPTYPSLGTIASTVE